VLHLCPTCRRRFDEAGFCPFDGTSLAPGTTADHPTVVSGPMVAQVAPVADALATARDLPAPVAAAPRAGAALDPTQREIQRRTFPLTPSPAAGAGTGEITAARTRPGPAA